MFKSIDQFIVTWQHEIQYTHNVLAGLTDESLSQEVVPGGRTLGRLGWHLTQTMPEMLHRTGLVGVEGPAETEMPPTVAVTITERYDAAAQSLLDQVKKNWTDDTLNEVDEMYGEKWKKTETLAVLVMHQAHHHDR